MTMHRTGGLAVPAVGAGVMRVLRASAAVVIVGAGMAVSPQVAGAASQIQVTITIHNVWEISCADNDLLLGLGNTCPNDYFVRAFFPAGRLPDTPRVDNKADIAPNWQLTSVVDRDAGPFPVRLQLYDHDSTTPDDQITTALDDANLDLMIDPRTGDFSGDIPTPNKGWSVGSGAEAASLFFSVALGGSADFDGDGIPDGIERGSIVDKLGNVPDHGNLRSITANYSPTPIAANPCRPTVLVEVDNMADSNHSHRPTPAAIAEAVATFDAGDVTPRLGCPYAGFSQAPGVQLIVVIDGSVAEVNRMNFATGPNGQTAQTIRNANFDARLRPYYHYALFIHRQPNLADGSEDSSSGLCCSDSNKDILVSLGGWHNNVGTDRDQSGTFVHELGHALGLGHGGFDETNCKPNYISAMNYVYQFGMPDSARPAVRDVNSDGLLDNRDRTRVDLSGYEHRALDEDALDERIGISGKSAEIFFWDSDGAAPWRQGTQNGSVDWNGVNGIENNTIKADVNFMGVGCEKATPPSGQAGAELRGRDDWATLQYKALLAAPSSGVHVTSAQEINLPMRNFVLAATRETLSQSDLAVSLTDVPDPVVAGGQLTYHLSVRNNHPHNHAHRVAARQTLPPEVTFVSTSSGCVHANGIVTCATSELAPGAALDATVIVSVPADLVHRNGGPKTISSTAAAAHDGAETNPADNAATASTEVVSSADLSITGVSTTGPREVLLGASAQFTYSVTAANGGPSTPIDAVLTVDATGSGAQHHATTELPALAVGSPRTTSGSGTVTCTTPGVQTVTVRAEIRPSNEADTDPDTTNNVGTSTVSVDCVVPIKINVRPRGFPNSINLNTDATVAALSTRAGEYGLPVAFDATAIDVGTTRWGLRSRLLNVGEPSGAREVHGTGHPSDSWELDEMTQDGDLDLVLHFKPSESGLYVGVTEACLKGRYRGPSGQFLTYFGCDVVRVLPG